MARRYYRKPRAYYNRKMEETNAAAARSALTHKLARASYYMMRDQVPFRARKLFGERMGWDGEPRLGLVKNHEI